MKKASSIVVNKDNKEFVKRFEDKRERFITQVDENEFCVHDSLEEAKNHLREIYDDIMDTDDIKIYAVTREYSAEIEIKVELSEL